MEFDQKVLVAGAGKSGICATKLLLERGAEVVLYDQNVQKQPEDFTEQFGEVQPEYLFGDLTKEQIEDIDLMIISPGIPVDADFTNLFREKKIPIWSEIELAYEAGCGEIAAITGTNGKTTTTTLVGEILKQYYKSTYVVGNIGTPYTTVANELEDYSRIVAEISSFQLETIHQFKPEVSAILNITPDHLNRHYTFENYRDTKLKITMNQDEKDVCVLNYDDPVTRELQNQMKAKVVFFSRLEELEEGVCLHQDKIVLREYGIETEIIPVAEIKILGGHNIENVMAAAAISYYMGVPVEVIRQVISEFMGVEHRIEYVATINDVAYYNDSKGTNPDAAIKGIQAMVRPTILIGGGYDKGVAFDEWIQSFDGKVRCLILIGQTAKLIADTAKQNGFEDYIFADSLEEAVKKAGELANPGDAVLLSPACASWGMFDNYEQRGQIFKELVHNLGV